MIRAMGQSSAHSKINIISIPPACPLEAIAEVKWPRFCNCVDQSQRIIYGQRLLRCGTDERSGGEWVQIQSQ